MNQPNPGEPVNIEDVQPSNPPTEPMWPLLANLIPWARARLALYSLFSLWMLIFITVVMPQVGVENLAEDWSWLFVVNGIGSILFPSVAAANVPKVAS